MCRIGGRLGTRAVRFGGANGEIPLFFDFGSNPRREQCQAGSLTGAVASQIVTEAPKGSLRVDGNHLLSALAQGSLTARPTSRAGTKVGQSDPTVPSGRAVA
jgi:hypothetical protein